MSFFSFATAQPMIVDPAVLAEENVKVEKIEIEDGAAVLLTVGIKGLPVGAAAQAKYLEQVFGVTGASAPDGAFSPANVIYRKDMKRNDDGTVGYSAEPDARKFGTHPPAFFYRATIVK